MNFDEVMKFYEELTTLRDEYSKSDNMHKMKMIATLAQLSSIVVMQGKIPSYFSLKHPLPYNYEFLITPVKELFCRLSMDTTVLDKSMDFSRTGESLLVNFSVKKR